jgi:ABC-type branched-subunit amino acid transport system substrate-binding protein
MTAVHNRYVGLRGKKLRKLAVSVPFLLTAAVLLGACSSSSNGSTSTTTAGSKGSKTLLIGLNAIESGPAATSYDQTQAFQAYLNYTNAQGGVNGYKFTTVTADNAYEATQSVEAQSKIDSSNPFTTYIVGTVPVAAVVPALHSQGVNTILFASADGAQLDSLSNSAISLWGVVPSYPRLVRYDAGYIMNTLKTKQFGVAYEDDSLAQGANTSVTAYVPQQGGHITADVPIPDTTTNFVPLATQLQSSGAKVVLAWAESPLLASLQKAAAQIGYHPTWVTPFFSLSAGYLTLAGSAANGTYIDGFLPPTTVDTPAMELYREWVAKVSPTAVAGGEIGWEIAAAMVAGIKSATASGQAPTASSLAQAMSQLNTNAALEQVNFTSGSHWGSAEAFMYQVQNGKFVQVQGYSPLPAG